MAFLRGIIKGVITILWTTGGVFLTFALSVLPIILTLVLIFGSHEHNWSDNLWRTAVYLLFILPGAAFLNMANFFARLKRSNPDLYFMIIYNGNWFEHVGRAGRSGLSSLHLRVSKLSEDSGEKLSHGLRMYAKITRYTNLFIIAYVMLGAVSILGFAVMKR